MDKSTAENIDELIDSCDLFNLEYDQNRTFNYFDFSNETIMVTGAAGSIGSELSIQLAHCKFKNLILIDIAESPLYNLIKDLEFQNNLNIKFLLLNITDQESLKHLFENYKPTMIFHAAAYKHVPLMEQHPYQAIKVNILGTSFLADLSIIYNVKKFIFISTDKAVSPINIMGMTKRIGEKYLKQLNLKGKTFFSIARFGNIIGSNGSLLPLLRKQIDAGGPITITCKETSRYFISKEVACQHILKVSNFEQKEGDVFTFDMGNPIKIIDILERIFLLYKSAEKDIEIKYTGLRLGEKTHESIKYDYESLELTNEEKIFAVKTKEPLKNNQLNMQKFRSLNMLTPFSEIKLILSEYL